MNKSKIFGTIIGIAALASLIAGMIEAPHWAMGFGAAWFLNEWRKNIEAKEEKKS